LDLSTLDKDAANVQNEVFVEAVDRAIGVLKGENGQVGNFRISNRLVTLEPLGEALVIGDLHGDFESLLLILRKSQFIQKMEKSKDATTIFLGDYGDRGAKPVEVYYTILRLKLTFPEQVVLLRGNHEGPKELMASPHDLPFQFQERFGENWEVFYEKTRTLWTYLSNAVNVEGKFLILHGGVSPEIGNLQDIAQAQEGHNVSLLEDLLWSDPDEDVQGVASSPRGAGKLFGKKVTEEVLRKLNAKILIRGHEACDAGYKMNHEGKILTLFSRKGAPYFNRSGAYLQLPLSEKPENAEHLVSFIHQF